MTLGASSADAVETPLPGVRLKTSVAQVRQAVAWQLGLRGIPTSRSDFSGDEFPEDRDGEGAGSPSSNAVKVKTTKDPRA